MWLYLCSFCFRGQSTEPSSESKFQKTAGWRNSQFGMHSRNLHQWAHRTRMDVSEWASELMKIQDFALMQSPPLQEKELFMGLSKLTAYYSEIQSTIHMPTIDYIYSLN